MKIIKELNYVRVLPFICGCCAAAVLMYTAIEKNEEKWFCVLLLGVIVAVQFISAIWLKHIKGSLIKLCDEKHIHKNIKEEVLNNYEKELLQNQTTVIMLQSQINPHFLYNTLDCIRGEAIQIGAAELASMTKALSNFFSYSISKSGLLVTISEELDSVHNYFLIQQFRFNRRFHLTVNCDKEDMVIMENVIPRLVLQPIIENSISHGFKSVVSDCELSITIFCTNESIHIKCSDNGCGISDRELEDINVNLENCVDYIDDKIKENSTHGLGIANINRRIKLLFGNEYGLYISSMKNAGTDVHIRLPIQNTGMDKEL
ncbi:sensor histidine kinase [Extibacter muris]|uniref:sensor histidine kinase n=1 Tax=Extibacter muris TaxID=1796622 RepID=UPI001D07FCF9|nr:histidine kinase [Extibacter muris]MCB6201230.1 histidine kinase [Extibacter muris]MCQ4664727.1 histidine kinase [Extibacter muris]MCQ4694571.1 histidine kinase [Extibacter muris]